MQVRDTSPHEFPKFAGVRGGGGSHRIEMATEIQCTPPERQSSVFVTKKAEGARRALPLLPTSRVVRHARRNLACKLIEGAHGQRGQIISAGRRVLVEGLSQQVHVASCDQATNCWRNSACGLYIGTIRSTPVRGLRKGPSLYGGLHFSYTLVLRSYLLLSA